MQESCGNYPRDPSWSSGRFPGAAHGMGGGMLWIPQGPDRENFLTLAENVDLPQKILISICRFPKPCDRDEGEADWGGLEG